MIHWPGMKQVDVLYCENFGIPPVGKGETMVQRVPEINGMWVAPRWIAWLYRILPNHANVNLTAWRTEPSHYLANIGAPTWVVGISMRRGIPAIVVHLGQGHSGFGHWYLPWGVRLYAKWTSPHWPGK